MRAHMTDTLRPRDYRFIAICALISGASLWIGVRYFYRAFPEASIDFQVTRESSQPIAERFLASHEIPISGYRHAARFQFDEETKVFLERELGLERANAIMGREVKLWRWGHRWYRPLEREEVTVEVTPRGEIASFQHLLPEDARGADLSAEAARSIAESFLVLEMRHSIVALEYLDSQTQKRPNRTDHDFTWKYAGREYRGATYRVSVKVQGDRVDGYSEFLKVPEEWSRSYARLRSLNETTTIVDSLLFVLILLALLVTIGRRVRRKDVRWKTALVFASVALVLQFLASLNNFPLAEYGFDTKGSWGSFIGRTFLSALFSGLGLGGLILVLTAGAEPLYREAYPEHLSISRMFTWHGIRTRSFFIGSLAGITLSFFFVAYVICFYLAANRLGAWAPAEVPYTDLLNTRVPWVFVLFGGFFPAVSEEWMFRAFTIPYFKQIFRYRWLAVFLASFIWGFGHANYPNQPFFIRGIEVGIAGLVFSWAMLRFGILAPLVAHYSIDAFYSAFLFLRSDNLYLVTTGAVTAGINLIPLLVATGAYLATRAFRSEAEVSNAAEGTAPPEVEEPLAPAAAPLPDYAPLARTAAVTALVLVGAGVVLALTAPARFGHFGRFRIAAGAAADAAARFLAEHGFDTSGYRRATQPNERVDEVGAQYVYTSGGLAALNRIYADPRLIPGVSWRTRFFKPLEKEEYDVATDPATGRIIAFRRLLPEEASGADLPREQALEKASVFLRGRGYDLAHYDLVETKSEKPKQRRDTQFIWEAGKGTAGVVGDARVRLEAAVLGDRVGVWTQTLKIPEEWRRRREGQNLYSISVLAVRVLFILALFGLALGIVIRATRAGRLRWKLAFAVAGAAALLQVLTVVNSVPEFLYGYDTRIDLRLFLVTLIAGAVMAVIGVGLAAALAAALVLACYPDADLVLRGECRRVWAPDAALAAVAAMGGFAVLQSLAAHIQARAASWALLEPIALPANLGSYIPVLTSLRDAALAALFHSVLLGFAIHLWRLATRSWHRVLLTAALLVSLLPAGARRVSEVALDVVPSVLLIGFLAWLVVRYFRNNYLAYVVSAGVLATMRAAVSLQGQGNLTLAVQAWTLAAVGIGLVLYCRRRGRSTS
jgi:membrane protease YdiL (CAAX protease family)